jgi:hypothetical protein
MATETSDVAIVGTDDLWVTNQYGDWMAAYRLVGQNGRLVIGELRVYPREAGQG